MPATVDGVRIFLGTAGARPVDDDALAAAVAAANWQVMQLRPDLTAVDPVAWLTSDPGDPVEWPANVDFAATLYAAQLYGRRGALFGALNYQEMALNMRTVDPHFYALLQLGLNQPSAVA